VENFVALIKSDGWRIQTAVLGHSAYWKATATNRSVIAALCGEGATLQYVEGGDELDLGGAQLDVLSPLKSCGARGRAIHFPLRRSKIGW
jgi:hypothetical protein